MKRLFKYVLLFTIALTVASCGKYGYDFEDGYQKGDPEGDDNRDTDLNYVDRSLYDRARIYPGMVGEGVRRIADTTIMLDLDFTWVKSNDLRVSVTPSPVLSTGLYAAAGENIRITVPQGVLGLTVQVGAHMGNRTGLEPLKRDPIIFTVKELFPGDNYVRNPYGGLIWIRAAIARTEPVALKVANAVRTSDFIRGTTNQTQWLADVEANDVPWLELRSERTIFTVPRDLVIRYKANLNVEQILAAWNEIYEKDYYDWMGLSPNVTGSDLRDSYPQLPERGVLDIQMPPGAYAYSGFPWVAQQDSHWFLMFSSYNYFAGAINSGESAWGTFHEIGHNYQQGSVWSWNGLGETTNNLFVFKTANRMGNPAIANHPALQGAFTRALAYVQSTGSKNFANPGEPWANDDNIPFFRLTPFLQIFNAVEGKNGESGWDFMPFLYTKARHSNMYLGLNQAKIDFFYRTLCEFTGKDYFRFFNAWGISLSNIARREMRAAYPPMDKQIWTYQPLDGTGGDGVLGSKYDLANSLFVYEASFAGATQSGDNGGLAVLNDGQYGTAAAAGGTFFHTCYTCGAIPLPFYIDMDLGSLEAFKGLYYGNRANSAATIPRMVVSISNDKVNWQEIGDFGSLPTTRPGRIEIEFDQVYEARYVRVSFPQLASNGHIMLSELGLFYDN